MQLARSIEARIALENSISVSPSPSLFLSSSLSLSHAQTDRHTHTDTHTVSLPLPLPLSLSLSLSHTFSLFLAQLKVSKQVCTGEMQLARSTEARIALENAIADFKATKAAEEAVRDTKELELEDQVTTLNPTPTLHS